MGNEKQAVATTNQNKVATSDAKGSKVTNLQAQLLNKLEAGTQEMGQAFTPYGKQCVINAIAGFLILCKSKEIELEQIDGTTVMLALQNIGYTELNCAALPSECYFDLRKSTKNGKTNYSVSIKPQGAGNEKLVRKYGVGVKELLPCWLVREGDKFVLPSFKGLEMSEPEWERKSLDGKVVMVVYPLKTTSGRVEYLMATREGIKPNIIAQIRQNALYADEFKKEWTGSDGKKHTSIDEKKRDEFYARIDAEFENLTVDQILANQEWMKWVNPTYTSGGSKEAMVIRKMKNNALKNYPKEYDNTYITEAVKNMFEENDESLDEQPAALKQSVENTINKVEKEIQEEETPKEDDPQDFDVDNETGEVASEMAEEEDEEELNFQTADHYEDEL